MKIIIILTICGVIVKSVILDVHLSVNVNMYGWILKHIALKAQHWENRTP